MRVIETSLPGVLVIEPAVHRDERGFFLEAYHAAKLEALGIQGKPLQVNQSRSVRRTLRGLHWQWRRPQAKLVRVLRGEIFDVAVDIRTDSPTFGQWYGCTLSEENGTQLYIPEGFAHGFLVIGAHALVEYKCTAFYDAAAEGTLLWNDPAIGIDWPAEPDIVSEKDRAGMALSEFRMGELPSVP